MNDHVTQWLNAYHDDELSGRRLRQVKDHLEICAECQVRLDEIQGLAMLLQESPAADDLLPQDVFVAQVGMRLPRKPESSLWKKVARRSWEATPFGLLGAWAVVQAVFIVSNVVLLALRLIPGAEQILDLLPSGGSPPGIVSSLGGLGLLRAGQFGASLFGNSGLLGWIFIFNVGITLIIGTLYWSWLASWWVRNVNGNHILKKAS